MKMAITLNLNTRPKLYFFIYIFLFSLIYNFDFELYVKQVLKDSISSDLINALNVNKEFSVDPNYLFLDALTDYNGESSLEKYKILYSQHPSYKYVDYAIFEVGSFYYTKGYYLKSSKWYKKIPMYYHDSKLIDKSIEMFFNTLEITNFRDSVNYYKNVFSKFYPDFETNEIIPDSDISGINNYDNKYTIQIGAFLEYSGAESRMYMLNSMGFGVRIEEITKDNKNYFVVREGNYSTRKSAEKISSRIKARTGIKCIIVEL
tara:strand:- start:300 stop:1082 length:783 start_codon:yes stop_codon:yes gene_type:complete